jgi:hypothetical protein
LDWQAVFNREYQAPIIPEQKHPGDTGNFEKYDEINLEEETKPTGVDPFKNLFKEF